MTTAGLIGTVGMSIVGEIAAKGIICGCKRLIKRIAPKKARKFVGSVFNPNKKAWANMAKAVGGEGVIKRKLASQGMGHA